MVERVAEVALEARDWIIAGRNGGAIGMDAIAALQRLLLADGISDDDLLALATYAEFFVCCAAGEPDLQRIGGRFVQKIVECLELRCGKSAQDYRW